MAQILSLDERDNILADLRHKEFPVLSDGHVMLVDVMGGDQDIVDAARVSYGAGTKRAQEDAHLIRFLMRHRHTTPFEMVTFKFRIRIPMDAWRQGIRHRTASVNEYSTRYSEAIDSMDETASDQWRVQSKGNKQGSSLEILNWPESESDRMAICEYLTINLRDLGKDISPGDYLTQRENDIHNLSAETYKERIKFGVAREQARKDLPLSNYTEAYWQFNLHNLLHMLSLRMDSHAQKEIRDYANVIGNEIVSKLCPVTWQAFLDYRMNAKYLTALDVRQIQKLSEFTNGEVGTLDVCTGLLMPNRQDVINMCLIDDWRGLAKSRERDECLDKLEALGLIE